jgi:CRISPR-associated protein Csd1
LLFQAVRRNRAEQTITRPRSALIKAVWLSNHSPKEEGFMVQLDPENDNAAYRCGRLLAVLERAQQLAIPGVNTTIVDRFFGTASSAPESVFPRLVRGAQPHLAKLERDRRGAARALQRRIEEILAGLPVRRVGAVYKGFPTTLSLTDQGLFSLGYYHERAHDRAQRAARRADADSPAPDDEPVEDVDTEK